VAQSINRKELRQPDEFVSFWTHVGTWINNHRRKVIAFVVIVVLGSGGAWGFTAWKQHQGIQETVAFARMEKTALAPLLPEKADKGEKAEDPKPAEEDGPRFKTDQERLQATISEADAFVAAHGAAGLGRRALLIKANALLASGKGAEAASAFEQLLKGEPDKNMRLVEQDGLALALEAQGQLDKAIDVYKTMADEARMVGDFYADRALYGKARLLQKQGKGKDAEKILREILDKMPKTLLRREIDDRLAVLADQ
jgi:predicted negative regulator of RcsB-dependent stress response